MLGGLFEDEHDFTASADYRQALNMAKAVSFDDKRLSVIEEDGF